MQEKLRELKARLAEVDNVGNAAAVLEWDQLTMMPPGGAEERSYQYATLQKMAHEMLTADQVGRLLEELGIGYKDAPEDDDDAALVRVATRQYRRQTQIPAALVGELSQAASLGQDIWARARRDNDFQAFLPHLEKIFDLKRRVAACFHEAETPYDALLDEYEPGMRTSQVRAMFAELKQHLIPLVQAISAKPPIDDAILRQDFDEQAQLAISVRAIQNFGYDFKYGRQDKSVHPFCTSFGLHDVRITTRITRNQVLACLMSSMHECGHALYELGYPDKYARSPLGHSASLGIHESQSRLWENLVDRSRGFWEFFYPQVLAVFPGQLGGVSLDNFYRTINRVKPSFIRVDADEVTYNLHTLLRFELEVDLLEGRLQARHAPQACNEKYKEYLGLDVPDDRLGVLQDTHWAGGLIGYFPTYTIGNLASAQFFDKALIDIPSIPDDIRQGRFDALLGWLRQNVHRHGRKYLPGDLVMLATGEPLSARPYLQYMYAK